MKKIFTILLTLATITISAQTLHKQYNLNYCMQGDCNYSSLTVGGGLYFCYVDDSMMVSGKQNMVLQKNDLNGNFLWKKVYKLNPSTPVQPVKMVSLGGNIFIGGTYGSDGFLTSIDTISGNFNYFRTYPPYMTITSIQIKDLAVLNNEIVMVGAANSSTVGVYMYVLRAQASNGNIITSGHNFLNDQRAQAVCCLNNSIYIVGSNSSFPFITKLRANGTNYTYVGSRMYNVGVSVSSSFQKIICNNNTMVAMGSVNNSPSNNIVVKIDTNFTATSGALIARHAIVSSTQFQNMTLNGGNTIISGYFGGMLGLAVLDVNLNPVACNTYSTFGIKSDIKFHNNNTYFSLATGNTGSNIKLMKGTNTGVTACSFTQTPGISFLTMTGTVIATNITISGSLTSQNPITYSATMTPTTTCLTTNINNLTNYEKEIKLLSSENRFEVATTQSEIAEVLVADLTGKTIYTSKQINQNNHSVNLSQHNEGLYFIHVRLINDQTKTFKVIKQ